ncbi:hypothetical protein BDW67DRAFT_18319 [Aspergillus spinulosporus]
MQQWLVAVVIGLCMESGERWWMTSRTELLATPLGFLNFPRTPPPPVPCPILKSVVARSLTPIRHLICHRPFQVSFILSVFQGILATSAPSLLCDTQALRSTKYPDSLIPLSTPINL